MRGDTVTAVADAAPPPCCGASRCVSISKLLTAADAVPWAIGGEGLTFGGNRSLSASAAVLCVLSGADGSGISVPLGFRQGAPKGESTLSTVEVLLTPLESPP